MTYIDRQDQEPCLPIECPIREHEHANHRRSNQVMRVGPAVTFTPNLPDRLLFRQRDDDRDGSSVEHEEDGRGNRQTKRSLEI